MSFTQSLFDGLVAAFSHSLSCINFTAHFFIVPICMQQREEKRFGRRAKHIHTPSVILLFLSWGVVLRALLPGCAEPGTGTLMGCHRHRERDDGTQKRDTEDVKLVTSCCVPAPVNCQVPRIRPRLSVKTSPESRIHASTLRMYSLNLVFVWPSF